MITGEEFKQRREDIGYRFRRQVAAELDVVIGTVKSWENGQRKVPRRAERWLEREEFEYSKRRARVASIQRAAARRSA